MFAGKILIKKKIKIVVSFSIKFSQTCQFLFLFLIFVHINSSRSINYLLVFIFIFILMMCTLVTKVLCNNELHIIFVTLKRKILFWKFIALILNFYSFSSIAPKMFAGNLMFVLSCLMNFIVKYCIGKKEIPNQWIEIVTLRVFV